MLPTTRKLALALAALVLAITPATALAKHGADDGPGDDRGGQQQSDDSGSSGSGSSGRDDSGRDSDDDSDRDDSGRDRGGDDDSDGRRGGDRDRGEVRVAGRCTNGATAKLKGKHDDGRLEVEFEVDQNRNGVTWNVVLRRNGNVAVSTRATTRAPSGSFSVERKITDGSGADRITARATSPSGEVCSAALTVV